MSDQDKRLQDRIALITGASRGIGREIAKTFAREGAQVVALARTAGGLEELDDEITAQGGLKPTLIKLDLRKLDEIDKMGAALYERYGKLDILVGNAGILGTLTPVSHIEPKDWDKTLTVNLSANYRLIRSLDPLLRLSDAGRAIFVTSGAAQSLPAYWATYSVSKAALDALVKTYAKEVKKFGIKANLLSPGPIRTRMRAEAVPGEDPMTLRSPDEIVNAFVEMAMPSFTKSGEIISLRP